MNKKYNVTFTKTIYQDFIFKCDLEQKLKKYC